MFVAELNGLLFFDPLTGVPRRTIQLNGDPQQGDNNKNSAIDSDFRQRVRTVMEDLGHCRRIREGTSHRYNLGDTVAHKPFALLNVYCKVLVLYQIDRNFQIASNSAWRVLLCVHCDLRALCVYPDLNGERTEEAEDAEDAEKSDKRLGIKP